MKVALELTTLAKAHREGTGRYAEMLLRSLLAPATARGMTVSGLCHVSRLRRRGAIAREQGLAVELWGDWLPPARDTAIVHATSHRLPRHRSALRIATIHDVYAALGLNVGDARALRQGLSRLGQIRRWADHFLCISEASRRDWIRHTGCDPARTHVVHHGVSDAFQPLGAEARQQVRRRYSHGEPYFLFLSGFRQNKNIDRLLAAFAASPLRRDIKLVLTGQVSARERARLESFATCQGLASRIVLTGYCADAELPPLYAAAEALLLPSLYEGFGLPILEAMASGTRVLTSTTGACPEVSAGFATLVDPLSVESIRHGLERVLQIPQSEVLAALAYARGKTWAETARRTQEVYREALARA